MLVRWPGDTKPGTAHGQLFAAPDWLATLVDIAGGPKVDRLNPDRSRQLPWHRQGDTRRLDQRDYLNGTSKTSARGMFFHFSGATHSAIRSKNWKMYYTMSQPGPDGWIGFDRA
jgi:arylsulfatase A-like enzyme